METLAEGACFRTSLALWSKRNLHVPWIAGVWKNLMKSEKAVQEQSHLPKWAPRLAFMVLSLLAASLIVITNNLLTERFTETTKNHATLRLALYGGNLLSELKRNGIVPQFLANDPKLIADLGSGDFSQSSQRLITFNEEINATEIMMLDKAGRVVAATDRSQLGSLRNEATYFINAKRSPNTVFNVIATDSNSFKFFYSRQIESGGEVAGIIAVEVNLQKFEESWAGISDAALVKNSEGIIILSTEPLWIGLDEKAALEREPASSTIARALRTAADWSFEPADAYLQGQAVFREESLVSFQGWRIVNFTAYDSIRQKVNGYLAIEVTIFSILLAIAFYFLNRKAEGRVAFFKRESEVLLDLNRRLRREMAEREKAEKELAVAEQTIVQSSKLAVLGEMSAAVSHELNQPLAAMKTYLAGARLLLSRNRPDEAVASFRRIDDLIEIMGSITKQLKSYARYGVEDFNPVDMCAAANSALEMMEPQLRRQKTVIARSLPSRQVMVMGDMVRIEQVIVNLLRNAMDATLNVSEPRISVDLAEGETILLTVRDNGNGIDNIESLFEPFYTTKKPGDGVGLGLAISSGIVNDMGGRLTARNLPEGGALFEIQLPSMNA